MSPEAELPGGAAAPRADERTGPRERVSIAVASFRRESLLEACLASLLPQAALVGADVIVARAGEKTATAALAHRFTGVRFVGAPNGADIPTLRGLALGAAVGGRAALTEDHCVASPKWLSSLLDELERGAEVAGGAMWNARGGRAIDWGAYFAEYGFFGPSAATDPAPSPTGANVAYAAGLVPQVAAWYEDGLWENVVHDRLRAAGAGFAFQPDARVLQNEVYRFGSFCQDRFEHGRSFARDRLAQGDGAPRWLCAAATPVLPLLLGRRVAASAGVADKRTFLRALPFTLSFLAAWSFGELAGYVQGAQGGAGG